MEEKLLNEDFCELTQLKTFLDNIVKHDNSIVIRNDISVIPKNVKIWQEFNQKTILFKDIFEERNEHEKLKNVFLEVNRIAKILKMEYEEIPIGVFCSDKEDLTKLEYFLAKITHELEKIQEDSRRRRKRYCFCC